MIYGCLQPRELWFIDFNHVTYLSHKHQTEDEGGPKKEPHTKHGSVYIDVLSESVRRH